MEKDLGTVPRTDECVGGALNGTGPKKCAWDGYVRGWGTYRLFKVMCVEAPP